MKLVWLDWFDLIYSLEFGSCSSHSSLSGWETIYNTNTTKHIQYKNKYDMTHIINATQPCKYNTHIINTMQQQSHIIKTHRVVWPSKVRCTTAISYLYKWTILIECLRKPASVVWK